MWLIYSSKRLPLSSSGHTCIGFFPPAVSQTQAVFLLKLCVTGRVPNCYSGQFLSLFQSSIGRRDEASLLQHGSPPTV